MSFRMWPRCKALVLLLVMPTVFVDALPYQMDGTEELKSATAGASKEDAAGWRRVLEMMHKCRIPTTANEIMEDSFTEIGGNANGVEGELDKGANGGNGETLRRLQRCLVDAAVTSLREVLQQERVAIAPGVELVRHNKSSHDARNALEESLPSNSFLGKALSLFRSYSLVLRSPEGGRSEEDHLLLGRLRRHQYKHMFPLMVMSFMAITSFLVPMGFQFMAVLGGKALLLSKMALTAASMLLYKKLATDFGHHPHPHGHGHAHAYHDPYYGFHDRSSYNPVRGKFVYI